jgi:Ca2+-binding RTX toxin-like protein
LINGVRSVLFSTDTTNATGGDDVISLGNGSDQAIAGVGNDTVTNRSGETIIIGDDGRIENDSAGRYLVALTGNTSIGGDDNVIGGSDRDIIFGGYGADRLDGQAGNDLIGGDGTKVTRNPGTIVLEAIDLFLGGDDTLLGGAGFDRMQGHYGSDLFFANFREDVLVGEYGRFTFDSNNTDQAATFIISLAQGKLDLIRQLQTSLFSGYAKQVFAESNLGQAARSRTALTTVFTDSAQTAVSGLEAALQATSSGGGEGADFVIPTEPTAAGTPEQTPDQVEGEEGASETAPVEGVVGAEAGEVVPDEQEVEQEECEVKAEDGTCAPTAEQVSPVEAQTDDVQTETATGGESLLADSTNIDVHAALAAVGGWAVMKDTSSKTKGRNKQKVA